MFTCRIHNVDSDDGHCWKCAIADNEREAREREQTRLLRQMAQAQKERDAEDRERRRLEERDRGLEEERRRFEAREAYLERKEREEDARDEMLANLDRTDPARAEAIRASIHAREQRLAAQAAQTEKDERVADFGCIAFVASFIVPPLGVAMGVITLARWYSDKGLRERSNNNPTSGAMGARGWFAIVLGLALTWLYMKIHACVSG